jgi:hypothetical protein
MVYSNEEGVILFGGIGKNNEKYNDFWILDLSDINKEYKWTKCITKENMPLPEERYDHTLFYSKFNGFF